MRVVAEAYEAIARAISRAKTSTDWEDRISILKTAIDTNPKASNISAAQGLLAYAQKTLADYNANISKGLVQYNGEWVTRQELEEYRRQQVASQQAQKRRALSSLRSSAVGGRFRSAEAAWAYADSLSRNNSGTMDAYREASIGGGEGSMVLPGRLLQRYKPILDPEDSRWWIVVPFDRAQNPGLYDAVDDTLWSR